MPFQPRLHPSSDCCLGYSLAHVAGALIAGGYNGYVACKYYLDEVSNVFILKILLLR